MCIYVYIYTYKYMDVLKKVRQHVDGVIIVIYVNMTISCLYLIEDNENLKNVLMRQLTQDRP